jgi:hypothetical protein
MIFLDKKALLSVAFLSCVSILFFSHFLTQPFEKILFAGEGVTQRNIFPIMSFTYCQGNNKGADYSKTSITRDGKVIDLSQNETIRLRGLPSSSWGYAVQNIEVPNQAMDYRTCMVLNPSIGAGKSEQWVESTANRLEFSGCPCVGIVGLGVPSSYMNSTGG